MAKVERFEDLQVWQRARCLAVMIYGLSNKGMFAKDFGLRGQIQRAVVSIVSNIAEGFDRKSNNQFSQFLEIAVGSASEVRAQLYLAFDLGYINQQQFDEAFSAVVEIGRMLTSFIKYLRTAPNRLYSGKSSTRQIPKPQPSNHQLSPSQLSNYQTIKPSN